MTTRQETMEKVNGLQAICRRWKESGWNLEDANELGKEYLLAEQRKSYEDEIRPLLVEILEKELLKFTATIPIGKRKEQAKLSEEGIYFIRTRDLRKMYYISLKDLRHKLDKKGNLLAFDIYPDNRTMMINWDMWKESNRQGNNWILRMWNGRPGWYYYLEMYHQYQEAVEKGIEELETEIKPYILKGSDRKKGKMLYTSVRALDSSGNFHLMYWKHIRWYYSKRNKDLRYVNLEVFRIFLLQLGDPAAYYIFPQKGTMYIDMRKYLQDYGYVLNNPQKLTQFTIPIEELPDFGY